MEDVDRLFECFKCGVSPPQSAVRERKTNQDKLNQKSSRHEVSACSGIPPLGSGEQSQHNVADGQLQIDKTCSVRGKARSLTSGKAISPVVFYGSPSGVPPKRVSRLLRLLREIHVDLSEQHSLKSRNDAWATFPRQDEAMKFAEGHGCVHVFSYQDHMNGQRRFLVSTYEEFWRRYKNMTSTFRHHYEVIQEDSPCHLYFDLEFNKKSNVEKNGDEMVDLLISFIFEALLEKYSIRGSEDWIVELDSSTEEKFSRHLIIRIPKTAFKDNLHAGAFVAEVCSRIFSARERDKKFEKLFVIKDSSAGEFPCQLFVDTAVYSRNRCFRLALSSKAGKSSVLLPTKRFKCKGMCEEDMFMASLICNMDNDCKNLLICKVDLDCIKTLHFDTEVNHNFGKNSGAHRDFSLDACSQDFPKTYLMGKSPFPALDGFVEFIASVGNVSGKIRCWYWFSESGLMVYSMSRNRYCERIGRQHKSNHVMYIVDIRRAVYYQKCYDPDCRGYRSPLRSIPIGVIPDTTVFSCSEQLGQHGEPTDNDLESYQEYLANCHDQSIEDSCTKYGWWLEAIKVADNVENMQKSLQFNDSKQVDDEDDEEGWMAVERTAAEAEL